MAKKSIYSRIGKRFHLEIEKIKDKRLRNGNSRDRISTEKVTNLIIRHKSWPEISEEIIKLSEKEVDEYGLE